MLVIRFLLFKLAAFRRVILNLFLNSELGLNPIFEKYSGFHIFLRVLSAMKRLYFMNMEGFFNYDHKTDKISHNPGTSSCVLGCFGYTPNLIFLEGMKSDTKLNTHLSRLVN